MTSRRAWYAVGVVLTAALIAIAAVHVGSFAVGVQEQTDRSVHAGPFRTVSLRTDSGDVTVRPSAAGDPAGAVVVEARRVGSIALPGVETREDGDRLTLDGRCRLPFDAATRCEVSFVVRVPPELRLRIDTRSGAVDISSVLVADVSADTRSGAIRASGVRGRLALRTGSGRATLDDLAGPSVDVRTSSGRITAERLRVADVVLDTGSGAITTAFAAAPYRVDARTGSGAVTVLVPPGDAYDVDVDTGSGGQSVGVATDAASPRSIRAKTGSGRVELRYSP